MAQVPTNPKVRKLHLTYLRDRQNDDRNKKNQGVQQKDDGVSWHFKKNYIALAFKTFTLYQNKN